MQPTGRRRLLLADVNDHIVCFLCGGYYVDATTAVECLHSFCKSCILRYLENNCFCPVCDVQIRGANASGRHLKRDKVLQSLVYKMVPDLYRNEMKRRRDFYARHPREAARVRPEERGAGLERMIFSPTEPFSLALQFHEAKGGAGGGREHLAPKRFLQCQAQVPVAVIKKFLRLKYDVRATHAVELRHKKEVLTDDLTLMDVAYIYTWKRNGPLQLHFRFYDARAPPPAPLPPPSTDSVLAPGEAAVAAALSATAGTVAAQAAPAAKTPLPALAAYATHTDTKENAKDSSQTAATEAEKLKGLAEGKDAGRSPRPDGTESHDTKEQHTAAKAAPDSGGKPTRIADAPHSSVKGGTGASGAVESRQSTKTESGKVQAKEERSGAVSASDSSGAATSPYSSGPSSPVSSSASSRSSSRSSSPSVLRWGRGAGVRGKRGRGRGRPPGPRAIADQKTAAASKRPAPASTTGSEEKRPRRGPPPPPLITIRSAQLQASSQQLSPRAASDQSSTLPTAPAPTVPAASSRPAPSVPPVAEGSAPATVADTSMPQQKKADTASAEGGTTQASDKPTASDKPATAASLEKSATLATPAKSVPSTTSGKPPAKVAPSVPMKPATPATTSKVATSATTSKSVTSTTSAKAPTTSVASAKLSIATSAALSKAATSITVANPATSETPAKPATSETSAKLSTSEKLGKSVASEMSAKPAKSDTASKPSTSETSVKPISSTVPAKTATPAKQIVPLTSSKPATTTKPATSAATAKLLPASTSAGQSAAVAARGVKREREHSGGKSPRHDGVRSPPPAPFPSPKRLRSYSHYPIPCPAPPPQPTPAPAPVPPPPVKAEVIKSAPAGEAPPRAPLERTLEGFRSAQTIAGHKTMVSKEMEAASSQNAQRDLKYASGAKPKVNTDQIEDSKEGGLVHGDTDVEICDNEPSESARNKNQPAASSDERKRLAPTSSADALHANAKKPTSASVSSAAREGNPLAMTFRLPPGSTIEPVAAGTGRRVPAPSPKDALTVRPHVSSQAVGHSKSSSRALEGVAESKKIASSSTSKSLAKDSAGVQASKSDPSVRAASSPQKCPSRAPVPSMTPLSPSPSLSSGSRPAPAPSPRPAPAPSPRPTPAPSPRPTPAPSPRPTPAPSPRPTPAPSPRPAPAPSPRPTPSASPRPTSSPSPRPTPSPSPRPAPSPSSPSTSPAPSSPAPPAAHRHSHRNSHNGARPEEADQAASPAGVGLGPYSRMSTPAREGLSKVTFIPRLMHGQPQLSPPDEAARRARGGGSAGASRGRRRGGGGVLDLSSSGSVGGRGREMGIASIAQTLARRHLLQQALRPAPEPGPAPPLAALPSVGPSAPTRPPPASSPARRSPVPPPPRSPLSPLSPLASFPLGLGGTRSPSPGARPRPPPLAPPPRPASLPADLAAAARLASPPAERGARPLLFPASRLDWASAGRGDRLQRCLESLGLPRVPVPAAPLMHLAAAAAASAARAGGVRGGVRGSGSGQTSDAFRK